MYYYVQGAAECGFQLQQRTTERIVVFIEVQNNVMYHIPLEGSFYQLLDHKKRTITLGEL